MQVTQGQNVQYGTGNEYAFGSFVSPTAQKAPVNPAPGVEAVADPQVVPGVNEYYQSISNLRSMVSDAAALGVDITRPDYTDPDKMNMHKLLLQAQGKAAALGDKLKKGAVLQKEIGEKVRKGEMVLGENFNFNVPLTEQYSMQNSRFAGMPQEIININAGLGNVAQTVSSYRSATRDYRSAVSLLRGRADRARRAGQKEEALKYEDQIKMLRKPRLENVQERIQSSASRATKIEEDKLNVQANTLSFGLNALEKSFETDIYGNVVLNTSGDPTTTQAAKDAIGMVVGAQVPGKPNTQVLGSSISVRNGRPAIILRYQQYEDYAESTQKGNDAAGDKNVFTTKGKRAIGPEGGYYTVKYLDGESQSSTRTDLIDMINEGRLKRGEKAIGYDRLATDKELNPSGYREQSYLQSGDAIIEHALKGNQPITAYREDVYRLTRQFPEMQEIAKRIQQNTLMYGKNSQMVSNDELLYNLYLNNAFNKINEAYSLKAGRVTSSSQKVTY
jgi:hypothetical protein